MPEPLKNLFSIELITSMANHFAIHHAAFDREAFLSFACANLAKLELKQRSNQILEAIKRGMPDDFEQTAEIMLKSLAEEEICEKKQDPDMALGVKGWAIMPMAEFVGLYGQAHFETSMTLLHAFTKRFTSEFAIRHFFLGCPEKTLNKFQQWKGDKNYHVRRLVSEGCRPRLPWGMQLPIFIQQPQLIMPLLEHLKDDSEEYVRRSVANNLNDIAKDHPDVVAQVMADWSQGASTKRQKLIRHAGRTLLKQGHPLALQSQGYLPPKLKKVALSIAENVLELGSKLHFSLQIEACLQQEQLLMIDFAVHHLKANGKLSAKVFKWKRVTLQSGEVLLLTKSHGIKPITTRTYYPGTHKLEVIINGVSVATKNFELQMNTSSS